MTTGGNAYPFCLPCRFQRQAGFVVLDQLRTVDFDRLHRRVGALSAVTVSKVLAVLRELFVE